MRGFAEKKVPGGKLVSVRLDYGKRINHIEILGDFFIYPEESLGDIEKSLLNADSESTDGELIARIKRVVDREGIEMIGVTPEAIAEVIKMAIK